MENDFCFLVCFLGVSLFISHTRWELQMCTDGRTPKLSFNSGRLRDASCPLTHALTTPTRSRLGPGVEEDAGGRREQLSTVCRSAVIPTRLYQRAVLRSWSTCNGMGSTLSYVFTYKTKYIEFSLIDATDSKFVSV